MGRKSSIHRLGAAYRDQLEAALADGATIDAITAQLNESLERAGRSERVSRSAVGRAAAADGPAGRKSSIHRLGAAYRDQLEAALADGATIDAITAQLNESLERAGRSERVSRSAVGRAAALHHPILERKRNVDALLAQLRGGEGAADDARSERMELLRTLLIDVAVAAAQGDGLSSAEIRDIASAHLNLERAEQMAQRRAAAAEQRAADAKKAGRAARRAGVSPSVEAAIRAAIEGRE